MKYLIINAEDFGLSKIFNEKILELIRDGFISSTSVMVDEIDKSQESQAKELSDLANSRNVSIGLHLKFEEEDFVPEIERQYEKFHSIFGFTPTHIDLHKSRFLEEAYPLIMDFCREKNIPCRNHKMGNAKHLTQTTNEVISGTRKGFEELKTLIENFREGESYEILFHPGSYDPYCESNLNKEREFDVEKIKKIGSILKENNVKLITHIDLSN